MRAPLAPIEARPAQNAGRAPAVAGCDGVEFDADAAEKFDPGLGHQPRVGRQLDITASGQRFRDRHAEAAGKVIVAGPRRAQGRIFGAGRQGRPLRVEARRHLHDAFHHLRHTGRGDAVVAVPALLRDAEQTGRRQTLQVAAGGLRRDTGDPSQLRRRQRAPVHQRVQHSGARRIPREGSDFCEGGQVGHGSNPCWSESILRIPESGRFGHRRKISPAQTGAPDQCSTFVEPLRRGYTLNRKESSAEGA